MRKILLLTLLFLTTITVAAQPRPHIVDQAHSQINFVAEARFISAHGHFDKWDAEVQLDPAKIETPRSRSPSRRPASTPASSGVTITCAARTFSTSRPIRKSRWSRRRSRRPGSEIRRRGRPDAARGDQTGRGRNHAGLLRKQPRALPRHFPDQSEGFRHDLQLEYELIEDVVQAQVDINVLTRKRQKGRAARPSSIELYFLSYIFLLAKLCDNL